jgi:hypothetical protein
MTPTVQLLVKNNYGNQALYPHNETAKTFAQLLGTKTITTQAIKLIMALGYEIEYIHGEVHLS